MELLRIVLELHSGMKSLVPDPLTTAVLFTIGAPFPGVSPGPEDPGAASIKADGGSPPMVVASPAFKAYGTASNMTRGCSSCPCTWTPSQRASPDANKFDGSPWLAVDPSSTL